MKLYVAIFLLCFYSLYCYPQSSTNVVQPNLLVSNIILLSQNNVDKEVILAYIQFQKSTENKQSVKTFNPESYDFFY